MKLHAKVSKGVAEIGKQAARAGAAAKRKAAKSKKSASQRNRVSAKTAKRKAAPKSRRPAANRSAQRSASRPSASTRPIDRRPGLISVLSARLFERFWPQSWWARLGVGVLLFAALIAGTIALGVYVRYKNIAAEFDLRQIGRMPQESVVFDTYGTPFSRLHGDGRVIVSLEDISPHFLAALIAREDTRFRRHGGIDLFGVARAMVRNAREGSFAQGASTLTMQLARISFEMRDKTMHRKLIEAALARRIEGHYSKDDILFFYVNRVFLGSGFYGIEAASRGHFGKSASALTLGEAAMLAGVIRAPNRFSPFRHYESALRERDTVLGRMEELEVITAAEAEAARREKIHVLPEHQVKPSDLRPLAGDHEQRRDSYLSESVRSEVERLLTPEQQQSGGLDIFTTFDLDLQDAAEQAVEHRLQAIEATPGYPHPTRAGFLAGSGGTNSTEQPDYLQAAVTVVDNGIGAVRALVGGRNFEESRYNRATQSRRQAGSIFKPLVYAIAFESGLFPGSLIDDRPIRSGELAWDTTGWGPRNSDGKYLGFLTAETGLIKSRNTMTVRVGEIAGIDAVSEMARYAGLEDAALRSGQAPSPQIYIGNLGASVMALTSAYSAFANEGFRAEPYFIERIQDRAGNVLYQRKPTGYRVVSAGASWMTTQILEKVMGPGGTGQSAAELGIDFPVAGKTGTTNDYRDAWFVGYSSSLSCGVWVGMDRPERIVDRGYGGRIALPIWADIMAASRDLRYPTMAMPEAVDVTAIELCRRSGQLASEGCRTGNSAYEENVPFAMIPRHTCDHVAGGGVIPNRDRVDPRQGDRDGDGLLGRLKGMFSES